MQLFYVIIDQGACHCRVHYALYKFANSNFGFFFHLTVFIDNENQSLVWLKLLHIQYFRDKLIPADLAEKKNVQKLWSHATHFSHKSPWYYAFFVNCSPYWIYANQGWSHMTDCYVIGILDYWNQSLARSFFKVVWVQSYDMFDICSLIMLIRLITQIAQQIKLEQLERLRSEDTPAAPWLPPGLPILLNILNPKSILLTSSYRIPSQNKMKAEKYETFAKN